MEKGIIKFKNNYYIKIIKINPINFNLKSDLEKEAILNSYKIFLKTCNFDIQILIQSNKEDLSKNISNIKTQIENEKNNNIKNISNKYINFISEINKQKKSSNKQFYIIIKSFINNAEINNTEELLINELNNKYFKIKECLSRCGNFCIEYSSKEEIKKILFSFLNSKKYLNLN